jgi:copper(I)-binding protein
MNRTLRGAVFALLSATPLAAAPVAQVVVSDAWFRALPGKLPAGGYFTLHNGTKATVALSGADSAACGMLMLHKSESMGGMASMSAVLSVNVAPGATLKFAPGGYHLMCMEPRRALRRGAKIPVILLFADGREVAADFQVRGPNGR